MMWEELSDKDPENQVRTTGLLELSLFQRFFRVSTQRARRMSLCHFHTPLQRLWHDLDLECTHELPTRGNLHNVSETRESSQCSETRESPQRSEPGDASRFEQDFENVFRQFLSSQVGGKILAKSAPISIVSVGMTVSCATT